MRGVLWFCSYKISKGINSNFKKKELVFSAVVGVLPVTSLKKGVPPS